MSIREVAFYKLVCDWPGCGASAHDDTEYSAWDDVQAARNEADYADGHCGTKWDAESEWYCDDHPAVWASDESAKPPPPYLLIHDGDTASDDDDGKVTLVAANVAVTP